MTSVNERTNQAVCIIVENLPVPFDRRVWQEARTLNEAGYTVSVICPKGRGFEKGHERLEEIDIYRYRLPWEGAGLFGYLVEYSAALTITLWLAHKVYRRTRFRVLQGCNPPDLLFLIALLLKPLGVKYLFDHHDLCPELYTAKTGGRGPLYHLLRLAEKATFATAEVVITTNESYKEIALRRGKMSRERTFVVRSCPDLSKVHLLLPQNSLKEGKKFLVVYLGVMGPQEGLDLLLEAIENILKVRQQQDVQFVLIGDGTERAHLMRMATAKGLDSAVRFTGHIPDEELALYLSTADICVAPDPKNDMNDKSTMNKILEYMAYGRPTVLFDLTEGRRSAAEAALYARPNDPQDMAEKIVMLLDSESLRRELGSLARYRIESELNWKREKNKLLKAYEIILSS